MTGTAIYCGTCGAKLSDGVCPACGDGGFEPRRRESANFWEIPRAIIEREGAAEFRAAYQRAEKELVERWRRNRRMTRHIVSADDVETVQMPIYVVRDGKLNTTQIRFRQYRQSGCPSCGAPSK